MFFMLNINIKLFFDAEYQRNFPKLDILGSKIIYLLKDILKFLLEFSEKSPIRTEIIL